MSVKHLKTILSLLILALLAFAVYWFAIRQPSPEDLIKDRLAEIADTAAKSPAENDNSGLLKAAAMAKFFTDRFSVEWPETDRSGEYESREVSQAFAATRKLYNTLRFTVSELQIKVTAPDTASVDFLLSADGSGSGGSFSDARLIHSNWYLVDGKWRIGSIGIRPVMGLR